MSMLRMKFVLAVLAIAIVAGMVPMAHATTPAFPLVIAGSSALWQTAALGAYNDGNCPADGVKPCFHWTGGTGGNSTSPISLQDCRVQLVGATNCNNDAGTVWVVWDSSTATGGPNVWEYIKVDTIVGDRCFYAQPQCKIVDLSGNNANWTAAGQGKIGSALWGDGSGDTPLTPQVLNIVEGSLNTVNAAATDIRPEDAAWAIYRANSVLGASTAGGSNSDGLDGLGYGTNPSGQNPSDTVTCPSKITLAQGLGTPVYSGYGHTGTSTDTANVLTFNITGKDPFSCTAIPAVTLNTVGGEPIVFVNSRSNTLASLVNATDRQLETVFSGTNVDASAFGLSSGNINAFLREPLSGTYNTTEGTVMRYPTTYSAATPHHVAGLSMENFVGTNNPLTCQAGTTNAGSGCRYRGIGTGEVVGGVQHSNDGTKVSNTADGIAYAFFSYGNVSPLADSTAYGYIQLNGVDPIFQTYNVKLDPGQPAAANGTIPGTTETTFPTCEKNIWAGGYSFPNVRNGTYRAWSILRTVNYSSQSTPMKDLLAASQQFVVTSVPDYIPAVAVTAPAGSSCGSAAYKDLGLLLVRSHYAQFDGNGTLIGTAPTFPGGSTSNTTGGGGDLGGMIIPTALGAPTAYQTYVVQGGDANGGLGPQFRH